MRLSNSSIPKARPSLPRKRNVPLDYLVHHMVRTSAERAPDKEAIVCGDQRISYQETWERIGSLASTLQSLGTKRGDRVGVFMEPCEQQALALELLERHTCQ